MKKKMYEKPSVEVVVLNHNAALLAGSNTGQRESYEETEEQTWQ